MSLGHGASIVRSGLVMHLDAANRKSYPGTGTVWSDLSGNNRNFSLNNTPTYNTGTSFTFDGVNETSSFTNFPFQIVNSDFTIRVIFFTSSTGSNDNILKIGNGAFNTGGKGLEIRKRGTSSIEFTVADGIGSGIRTSINGNYTNRWFDLTVTFLKSTEAKWYVNGVFGSAQSYAGETNITDIFNFDIGQGGDSFFPGSISIISLYNRVLSITEIQQNFEATRGRYGI